MSKGPSPTAIGGFVLAGLVLAVGAAVYFGSVSFSGSDSQFVLFFDESVAGLGVGAKVKLRGVPIGDVTRISLRLPNQADTDPRIPVFVEINAEALRRLGALNSVSDYDVEESLGRAIDGGLRGMLQLESLITGMYYIELDYQENPDPPEYAQDPDNITYWEIPTIPSQFAEIGRTATDVAMQIATIPFGELSANMLMLGNNINAILTQVRDNEVVGAATDTLEELRETIAALNQLVDRVDAQVDPLSEEFQSISEDVSKTLASLREGVASAHAAGRRLEASLAPDSTLVYRLEHTLSELSDAAAAIQRLAEQVERNPAVVVRGRAQKESAP